MDISNLAKEFAKIVKPEEKPVDVTLYGTTVISNGQLCVQLDGSDEITPAESTIEVAGGQRVAVLIKNHKAVITGSTTERAASSEDVDELYGQEMIFNILTNNGQEQGLFLQNGKVYLNFSYAEGGTLKLGGASQNQYGILKLVDTSDNDVILMDNTGLKLYDTDGTTVVGAMGPSGFTLKGGSRWDYDYSYSGVTGTCTFDYGLRTINGSLWGPGISLTNNRSDVQATGVFDICNDGYQTELHSTSEITLGCSPGDGNRTYIDLYTDGAIQIAGAKWTNNIEKLCCIDMQPMAGTRSEIVLYTPETHLNIDQYGVHTDQDFILDTAAKGLLGTVTGTNQTISMIAFSGSDNIVIGQTTDQSEYGDINLRAGTKGTNSINIYGKTTTSGTLSTGGTITSGGGLYTNSKTGVDDGVAGAAITTTGTIQLSASGTPYIYFRYANSTSYYTRIAQTKATANRTLTMPNSTGTLAISSSDIRVKENIKDSPVKALDLIEKIKLHAFDWTEEGRGGSPHWKCGIIADELEELDAELTSGGGYNEDGSLNVKSIDTLYLEGYIVKALQEMSERIEKLEERT